jgi:hypothetical protein
VPARITKDGCYKANIDRSTAEFCVWLQDKVSDRFRGLRNFMIDTRTEWYSDASEM